MLAADGPVGIGVAFLPHQGDVAHGALVGGAGVPAGGNPLLLDGEGVGHGLGRVAVGGLARAQAQIERVVDLDRADVGALAAAGAAVSSMIAGFAAHVDVEIADITGNLLNFAVGQQLNVFVASNGHHFGCEYSSRTVERREGLVQLGHMPADGRFPLDQIDLLAGVGQLEGRLDAGNAAADHQGGRGHIDIAHLQRLVMAHPADGGSDHFLALAVACCLVIDHPGALLADIGHLEEEGVQPGFFHSAAGRWLRASVASRKPPRCG